MLIASCYIAGTSHSTARIIDYLLITEHWLYKQTDKTGTCVQSSNIGLATRSYRYEPLSGEHTDGASPDPDGPNPTRTHRLGRLLSVTLSPTGLRAPLRGRKREGISMRPYCV